jgi:prepilin-type processing-associated H-X9-DG protein
VRKCPNKTTIEDSYVYNSYLSGRPSSTVGDATRVMVTADGTHKADAVRPTGWSDSMVDNLASWYSADAKYITKDASGRVTKWSRKPLPPVGGATATLNRNAFYSVDDLDAKRHGDKYICSYLDGHVDITKTFDGADFVSLVQADVTKAPVFASSAWGTTSPNVVRFDKVAGNVLKLDEGFGRGFKGLVDFNADFAAGVGYTVVLVRKASEDVGAEDETSFDFPGGVIKRGSFANEGFSSAAGAAFNLGGQPDVTSMWSMTVTGSVDATVVTQYINGAVGPDVVPGTAAAPFMRTGMKKGVGPINMGSIGNVQTTPLGGAASSMELGEVLVFGKALNATEMGLVYNAFRAKYGLP